MNSPFKRMLAIVFAIAVLTFSCDEEDCAPATPASAGEDQVVIGTSTTLAANNPEAGSGEWTIVSGEGGEIADVLDPVSSFSGTVGNAYTLRWTISGCPVSEDEVTIEFICDPALTADAGSDQTVVGTSATLNGNGTGTWSIVSGAGGNIAQPGNAASNFTGVVGTTYVLEWTVTCPASEDQVQITFTNTDPQFLTIDKTSVINGEIITLTGANFSANYNGGSQINAIKSADPLAGQEVYLSIISRTSNQIEAVMTGTNGGATGQYNLRYNKKPDAGAATLYPSALSVTINAAGASQFFTTSSFTANNVAKGGQVSFGVKNGSLNAGDYTVKLVHYDYTTGASTEYDVTNVAITAQGFGGGMDKLAFTVPANLPTSEGHVVKVTYGGSTVVGGWGSYLNIF